VQDSNGEANLAITEAYDMTGSASFNSLNRFRISKSVIR
jgi:hypothetical protein